MASKDAMQEISWISAKLLAIMFISYLKCNVDSPVNGLREAILGILGSLESWKVGWHVKAKDQPSFLSFSQYLDKIALIQVFTHSLLLINIHIRFQKNLYLQKN